MDSLFELQDALAQSSPSQPSSPQSQAPLPDEATHFVLFEMVHPNVSVNVAFLRKKFDVKTIHQMPNIGCGVLEFYDIRHAVAAYKILATESIVEFIDYKILPTDQVSHATLLLSGVAQHLSQSEIMNVLAQFGDVWFIHRIEKPALPAELQATYLVEYYDFRDALFAKTHFEDLVFHNRLLFCDFLGDVSEIGAVLKKFTQQFSARNDRVAFGPTVYPDLAGSDAPAGSRFRKYQDILNFDAAEVSDTPPPPAPQAQQQQSLQNQPGIAALFEKTISRPPGLEKRGGLASAVQAATASREKEQFSFLKEHSTVLMKPTEISTGIGENQLDLAAIASGVDQRTTFMIRNIPNKYTQQMLIDMVNETHQGKYDFLYLRMDFKNRCNVGYAFINFPNPQVDVITFATRVCGKKWIKYNSDKICTMSYANIQGRDSLIAKFRDSQVMFEDESYRPKLFYVSGARSGQEEPFPPPTRSGKPSSAGRIPSNSASLTTSDYRSQSQHLYEPEHILKIGDVAGMSAAWQKGRDFTPQHVAEAQQQQRPDSPEPWTPWNSQLRRH